MNQAVSDRDAKREALRKKREAELKRQRRTRITIYSIITILAILLSLGIIYLIYQSFKPEAELPLNQPTSISADAPYLSVGNNENGGPTVDVVLDFMCPFCGQFEQINGEDLKALSANGDAKINFYLRTFLSEAGSTNQYSARAASAAVCTYEESPELFFNFQQALFLNQPQEGGPGLSDAEMVKLAADAGASSQTQDCISQRTYQRFATEVLEPAGAQLATSTPAIFINGEKLEVEELNGQQIYWTTPGYLRSKIEEVAATK